jgi:chemotaxis protein histidine kinase CheA/CheY-like chemotaxis protein
MDELLGEFLAETGESLDRVDLELVRFEQEPDNVEMLNTIFRLVHTVKGTCGFMGLQRLAKLAHAAETLIGQYRDRTKVTVEGVSLVLATIDRIKQILYGIERTGSEPPGSDADLIGPLESIVGTQAGHRSQVAPATGGATADVRYPLLEELERAWRAAPEPEAEPLAVPDGSRNGDGSGLDAPRRQTVRVSVDTLEHLMTTVSELVLTRNQLLELVRHTGDSAFKTPLQRLSELKSTSPKGTVFVIKIPLTLAIMAVLIVETAGQRFAIPQFSVVELVRAGRKSQHNVELINDAAVVRLRDKLLPLLDFGQLLKLDGAKTTLERVASDTLSDTVIVVVMQIGARRFGVLVDGVYHTEEIVVKPVSSLLRDVGMFSGNTILGDGSVIMIVDPNALGSVAGPEAMQDEAPVKEQCALASTEAAATALLLFRAGSSTLKAVPVSLITRLEEIDAAEIERCNGSDVVQYRGALMPLVYIDETSRERAVNAQPVLVFTEERRHIGLAIDAIVDIVEAPLEISSEEPGLIGAAIVRGEAVEIVDVSHYLGKAFGSRAAGKNALEREVKLLLVDDSQFFRDMLAPLLTASGYDVTVAASAEEALHLKDHDARFDLIVTDLEMPGMDGIAFAERLKGDQGWGKIPLIALSSYGSPSLIERTRAAGFATHVGKFDRQKLMDALADCCKQWGLAA